MKKDEHFKHLLKIDFLAHEKTLIIINPDRTGEQIKTVGLQNCTIDTYLNMMRRQFKQYRNIDVIIFKNHYKIIANNYQKRFLDPSNGTFNFLLK